MSGKLNGETLDVSAVREGAQAAAHSNIPHADLLVRYAEALVAHDDGAIAALREPIRGAVGDAGLLETITVAANFQRMVRIADGTGIPQEAGLLALGSDVIEELSLRDFASASHTAETGLGTRLLGALLRPIAPKLVPLLARRARRRARSSG